MALTGGQRRWMRQPSGLVRINEGHWLADRLVFAHTGAEGFVLHERVAPAALLLSPAAGGGTGRLGSIQQATPDGTNYTRYDMPARAGDGLSLVAWVYGIAGTSENNLFSVGNAAASDGNRALYRSTTETYIARRSSTTAAAGNAETGFVSGQWQHLVGTFTSATVSACWVDGVGGNETAGNSRIATTANAVYIGTGWRAGISNLPAQTVIQGIGPSFVISGVLSAEEVARLYAEQLDDPWSVFAPPPIWVPVSSGGTHTSTGALASDAATIAGTAAHLTLHTTSGALASDAATIAGTAVHLTLHTTEGALASDAAVIAGTADHAAGGEHPTEGALASDAATIAGTAAHYTLHATTGALASDTATIAGTAAHLTLHATSGALQADPATMAGVAVHSGAGAVQPSMQGAGRPSRRRPRVVEIDGEDFVVSSAEEAQALLDQAKEQAKELAATAIKRAGEAKKRPAHKVIRDARRLLEVPEIRSEEYQPLVDQAQAEIRSIYESALASVEIAALLAKRQREEEDDEDVLLLLV